MCKEKRKRSGCTSKGAAPIQSYPDYSSIVQPLLYTQPLNIYRKDCTKIFLFKMSSNNKARSINTSLDLILLILREYFKNSF